MLKKYLPNIIEERGATAIETIALAAVVMVVLLAVINYLNGVGGELIKFDLINSIQSQIDTWNDTGYR